MVEAQSPAAPRIDRVAIVRILWIVYWVVLTGLLLSPKLPRSPVEISRRGLVAHCISFGLLALGLIVMQRTAGRHLTARWAVRWLAVFAAYGALAEILQPYMNRSCDLLDWLCDVAGAAVVMLVALLLRDPDRRGLSRS
jgi:VanZ family protein